VRITQELKGRIVQELLRTIEVNPKAELDSIRLMSVPTSLNRYYFEGDSLFVNVDPYISGCSGRMKHLEYYSSFNGEPELIEENFEFIKEFPASDHIYSVDNSTRHLALVMVSDDVRSKTYSEPYVITANAAKFSTLGDGDLIQGPIWGDMEYTFRYAGNGPSWHQIDWYDDSFQVNNSGNGEYYTAQGVTVSAYANDSVTPYFENEKFSFDDGIPWLIHFSETDTTVIKVRVEDNSGSGKFGLRATRFPGALIKKQSSGYFTMYGGFNVITTFDLEEGMHVLETYEGDELEQAPTAFSLYEDGVDEPVFFRETPGTIQSKRMDNFMAKNKSYTLVMSAGYNGGLTGFGFDVKPP
jgi:hypothetical protein